MNSKAQSLGLSIMSAIFILLVGFMSLNFLTGEVTQSRIDMACSDSENIEDGNKLFCLVAGLIIPYFIWIVIGAAIGAIVMRFVF